MQNLVRQNEIQFKCVTKNDTFVSNRDISYIISADSGIDEVCDAFQGFLLAVGFTPETIRAAFRGYDE